MSRIGNVCAFTLIVIAVLSLFAPFFSPYDPNEIHLESVKESPGRHHLLGTDNKGRDVFTRILYGGRISLGVAVTALFFSMIIGTTVGLLSGYCGGGVDLLIMGIVDLILSFPTLLLAIGIGVLFPSGTVTVVVAISSVGWASFARVIRGQVLSLRESTCIEAARSIGCGHARILFRHLLPQCLPLVLVIGGLKMGSYILTESALGFLGLGAQPPTATWGSMVSANRIYLTTAPWTVLPAGFMIAVTVLCCNVLGDALRDRYAYHIGERM